MSKTVAILPTPRGQPPGLRVDGDLAKLAILDRSQMASQGGRKVVPGERFELPTNGLQNRCSTTELTRQIRNFHLLILNLSPDFHRSLPFYREIFRAP